MGSDTESVGGGTGRGEDNQPDVDFDFDLAELGVDEAGLSQDEFLPFEPESDPSGGEAALATVAEAAVEATVETAVDPSGKAVGPPAGAEASTSDLERPESFDEDSQETQDAVGPGSEDTTAAGNWRALFERELRPLAVDARVEMARGTSGERLNALCYDPSPRVISALVENQGFGLQHARRVAAHHRTGGGLDAVGRQQIFVRDRQVQRNLFRNSGTPQGLLLRILQSYRLAEIYRLTSGREATERARSVARKQLRAKFPRSSAEERVQLLLKTEGRCLPQLVGIALGGRATALLCRRPLVSTLLIRNLARWPSTPPPVLQHMARQPSVRRSPVLRNEILRHPNAPSRLQTDLGG